MWLKVMRRSHKYSFFLLVCGKFPSVAEMYLWTELGCSWYRGVSLLPVLATGLLESLNRSYCPSRVPPPSVVSFGWASVLMQSLSNVSEAVQCPRGLSAGRVTNIRAPSVALGTASIHVSCRTFCITPVLAVCRASLVFVTREGVVAAQRMR